MSSPVIFIFIPIFFGFVFTLIRRHRQLTLGLATAVCAALAIFAWVFPLGQVVPMGNLRPEIGTSITLLGRSFILDNQDRTVLVLMFAIGFLWFFGSSFTWAHRFFAPFGMGILAALVAALAVEPFLYSALLVEIAVLLSIPILAPPGHPLRLSVQRFLIFQTLAMPFILFSGWLVSLGETNPSDQVTLLRASAFLALGFAFWLAVFPFYSWMPQLAAETHPYPAGFILAVLPIAVLLIGLNFLNGVGWLRSSSEVYPVLRIVGVIMVSTGGIWAAFQKNVARLLGYGVIVETGFALLALGLHSDAGMELFAAGLLARVFSIFLVALALGCIYNHGISFEFSAMQNLGAQMPYAAAAVILGLFSMGGLPLLGSFPIRVDLFEQLAVVDFRETILALIGSAGFLFAAIRVLAVLVIPIKDGPEYGSETTIQRVNLSLGIVIITALGLFPATIQNMMLGILQIVPLMYPLR